MRADGGGGANEQSEPCTADQGREAVNGPRSVPGRLRRRVEGWIIAWGSLLCISIIVSDTSAEARRTW